MDWISKQGGFKCLFKLLYCRYLPGQGIPSHTDRCEIILKTSNFQKSQNKNNLKISNIPNFHDALQPLMLHRNSSLPLSPEWGRHGLQVCRRLPHHQHQHCLHGLSANSQNIDLCLTSRGPIGEQVPLWLPPRSLLVLTGPARWIFLLQKCDKNDDLDCNF